MKRILSVWFMSLMPLLAMADGVTPEQALEQAQSFIQKREAEGIRPRRAPGKPVELTPARQVNGLYVFNIDQNDGFVIVSNDDRTTPILGYSDKGNLDPDNMPDNLRAWLQGYADEIAWMNEHPSAADVPAEATRRTPTPVRNPIAPLLTTKWDQYSPYNNLCPLYDGKNRSVAGCLATAMAQVMCYTERKAGNKTTQTTAKIPSYTTTTLGIKMPAIPAGSTIDWENMIDDYSGEYTEEQAQAVATLMLYCGTAVEMKYGLVSGANASRTISALQAYFGYEETCKQLTKSHYSYEKWLNLLYHELSESRPMIYKASSKGLGHAFVCDGYEGEEYFHFNWGWSGTSNGYYKLSALNPHEQGIGGSNGEEGYNYAHDAFVGIQKKGETGTVLAIEKNHYKLTLNSISLSPTSVKINDTVNATFNITNSGSEAFEGSLLVFVDEIGTVNGKSFVIEPGETKDYVIPFTAPSNSGIYNVNCYLEIGNSYLNPLDNTKSAILIVKPGNPTSDDINLVSSLIVDHSEGNNFYGTTFKGTLTITNPESDKDYEGWYYYEFNCGEDALTYAQPNLTIRANSSTTIPIEIKGLDLNQEYYVRVTHYMASKGFWSSWDYVGTYTCKPGIFTYYADGTESFGEFTGKSYAFPDGTAFADLSGTGIETVTNVSPNCLVFIDNGDIEPTGATNIVKKNGSTYIADHITLTDNNNFYSPFDFTAERIEFDYDLATGTDGTGGWNTIMLPFEVSGVTANGEAIDWFHSSSDTGKNFWLREFVSDEPGTVYFNDVAGTMKANTPYIVAFPSEMGGKNIKFIGTATNISKSDTLTSVTGFKYIFRGSTKQDDIDNIYCMNAAGNGFELKATGHCTPFHAYFESSVGDASLENLKMGFDETTGINDKDKEQSTKYNLESTIYDLSGRRVINPTKGFYIRNGKKIIIK